MHFLQDIAIVTACIPAESGWSHGSIIYDIALTSIVQDKWTSHCIHYFKNTYLNTLNNISNVFGVYLQGDEGKKPSPFYYICCSFVLEGNWAVLLKLNFQDTVENRDKYVALNFCNKFHEFIMTKTTWILSQLKWYKRCNLWQLYKKRSKSALEQLTHWTLKYILLLIMNDHTNSLPKNLNVND